MSGIEWKEELGLLHSAEDSTNLLLTATGSVAEAISSALETADANNIGEHDDDTSHLSFQNPVVPTENFQTNEDKLFLSNNNKNNLLDLDKEGTGSLVRRRFSEGSLLERYSGRASPFHEVNHNYNCNTNHIPDPHYNQRLRYSREDYEPRGNLCLNNNTSSSTSLDSGGNHVCEIHEISSTCSPFISSTTATTSSMESSKGKESSEYYCASNSSSRGSSICGSDQNLRDKPDNRETHSVGHYKERSATEEPTECSGVRTGHPFKPSSKVIELPERSSSSSTSTSPPIAVRTTGHSHHHHHRHKQSKIPVGIAVAWQRLVTSTSTSTTTTTAMTSRGEANPTSKQQKGPSSHSKIPARPTSASPLSIKSTKHTSSSTNLNFLNGNVDPSDSLTNRPLSAFGGGDGNGGGGLVSFPPSSASPLSRPLPSSSVPPNMGFPVGSSYPYSPLQGYHHHRSTPFLDFPYGTSPNVDRTFAIPTPLSSPHQSPHPSPFLSNGHHPYWGGLDNPTVPLLASGECGNFSSFNAPKHVKRFQRVNNTKGD